jgi:TM2 domain-containing membrane protein YozV
MAMGDSSAAELELLRVLTLSTQPAVKEHAGLVLAEHQIRALRWQDARASLGVSAGPNPGAWKIAIDSLFTGVESVSLKSPQLASRLSGLLPGLGQAYVGEPIKAIHALAVNAIFGYWVVESILDRHVAVAASMGFLRRYYQGNRIIAARLARQHNQRRLQPHIQDIADEIVRIRRTRFPSATIRAASGAS